MANTILTDSVIAKESLRLLENNIVFARGVNRKYEKNFEAEYKIGDTVNVRVPAQYTVRSGATAAVQDHADSTRPVKVDTQLGIDVSFTSAELALSLQDFSEHVLKPQIATLANEIDLRGLQVAYRGTPNAVGTPGTAPSSLLTVLQAGQKLDENGCPQDDQRSIILNPAGQVGLVDGLKGLFQSSNQIKDQYEKGRMGTAAGFDFMMSQNIPSHTVGAYAGAGVATGAAAEGDTAVATSGWTGSISGLLKKGDVFTIAGVFAVNPMSKQSTGALRQFTVTADVNSSSGLASIPCFPALFAAGAKKTVTALPAASAAITVIGTAGSSYAANLAYHKDAFTLVTVDLPLPKGMDMAARASSKQAGLSIRMVRGFDITNDKFISRLDVLLGWAAIRPELACRVHG